MTINSVIRTIYLYLFAVLGLVLLTIGGVQFINLGLKMTIFKKADADFVSRPPALMVTPSKTVGEEDFISAIEKCEEKCELTEDQQAQVASWLADYKVWHDEQKGVSYATQNRQRQASMALALLIIGLPLYLYHWGVIKREIKKSA